MVVTHNVKGYDEFTKKMEELENGDEPVHVLFSGGKDEKGESWCPYCVKGEHAVIPMRLTATYPIPKLISHVCSGAGDTRCAEEGPGQLALRACGCGRAGIVS